MSTDWLVRLLIVRRESLSKSTLSVKVEPKCSLQWYLGAHQNPQKNFLVAEQLWPKERYPMGLHNNSYFGGGYSFMLMFIPSILDKPDCNGKKRDIFLAMLNCNRINKILKTQRLYLPPFQSFRFHRIVSSKSKVPYQKAIIRSLVSLVPPKFQAIFPDLALNFGFYKLRQIQIEELWIPQLRQVLTSYTNFSQLMLLPTQEAATTSAARKVPSSSQRNRNPSEAS
ncbi:hypothetical protein M9H77_27133 [Catharanthus roseus]|uniref:Uncharacterized protein n=1 Tax=Catharanthus roseus TaxID=4058 RepID=A0ACC0ADJ2_CATRO|nr:hypothetical protein M9H77_27133 [Catharanthus roseus]